MFDAVKTPGIPVEPFIQVAIAEDTRTIEYFDEAVDRAFTELCDIKRIKEKVGGGESESNGNCAVPDIPERFLHRSVLVSEATDDDLDEESKWIYRLKFQEDVRSSEVNLQNVVTQEIKQALQSMRNDKLDVPATWHKLKTELRFVNAYKLWEIYWADEEYCLLQVGKHRLKRLLEDIQIMDRDVHRPVTSSVYSALKDAASLQELREMFVFLRVVYTDGMSVMVKGKDLMAFDHASDNQDKEEWRRKLLNVVKLFDFQSISESIRRDHPYPIEQHTFEPLESCVELVTLRDPLRSPEAVLECIKQIAVTHVSSDITIRQKLRKIFEAATVTVRPTPAGIVRIDENHPLYRMKYLKDKPVASFKDCEFLKLVVAEQNEHVTIKFNIECVQPFLDHLRTLVVIESSDYFSRKWNEARLEVLQVALERLLIPSALKELRNELLEHDHKFILKKCSENMRGRLSIGPYKRQISFEQRQIDRGSGLRVVSIAYHPKDNPSVYAVFINRNGVVRKSLAFQNLLTEVPNHRRKQSDLKGLKKFILKRKPNVIVISGASKTALMLQEDVQCLVTELNKEGKLSLIDVEILDSEVASVYLYSQRAHEQFTDYPAALKEAILLGWMIQEPLIAYCQLSAEELLCLRYHEYQDYVPKDQLKARIVAEIVQRVCGLGVDINRCLAFPQTSVLLQYVAGLGPTTSEKILAQLHESAQWIREKSQLASVCKLIGPKLYDNISPFIRIETARFGEACNSNPEEVKSKDSRTPYATPSREELFRIIMKVPVIRVQRRLVQCQVLGPSYVQPDSKSLLKSHELVVFKAPTKTYHCLLCKNEFKSNGHAVAHFTCETKERCPGELTGFRVQLQWGLTGFILTRRLSDETMFNPYERFRKGKTMICRVGHVDLDGFVAECSTRASDIYDAKGRFSLGKDEYFDFEAQCHLSPRC